MHFDTPAIITECDGCNGRHTSIENWVSCLIKNLNKYKREVDRLRPMAAKLQRIENLGKEANALGSHWNKNGKQNG